MSTNPVNTRFTRCLRSANSKTRKRVTFDPKNSEHIGMLKGSVSDDDTTPQENPNPGTEDTVSSRKGRSKKLARTVILFGQNEDIDPSELDERGNIKDLIDYSDENDYAKYQAACKKREGKDAKMSKNAHIVFSITPEEPADTIEEEEEDEDEDDEEGDDEDEEEADEEEQNALNILIPFLLGVKNANPQSNLQARVLASNLPPIAKEMVVKRLDNADLDKPKTMEWVESVLAIPFGKYATTPVTIRDSQEKLREFFDGVIKRFDSQIHGLQHVKQEIINYIGQFITTGNETSPRVLALWGNAGVGKTHILRTALSEALNRPIRCINMGGVKDSVFLIGFDYTYSSARYGVLVQTLIEKQVMNPIILFEEVDKISETKDGADLENILMSLTDPETNTAFQDKYFSGLDIDFSKAICVFTLNDPTRLNPILLNRLNLVKVPDPTLQDKIIIAMTHMIPMLCSNVGFDPGMISFTPEIISYINNRYCSTDKGLRMLKRSIESIILRLNMIKLTGVDFQGKLKVTFPVAVSETIVDIALHKIEDDDRSYLSMYM